MVTTLGRCRVCVAAGEGDSAAGTECLAGSLPNSEVFISYKGALASGHPHHGSQLGNGKAATAGVPLAGTSVLGT
jgi:hypothetical protein